MKTPVAPYLTISAQGEGEYKEKNSRFLGYAMHVHDEKEALANVHTIAKTHYKANHCCYAYKLDPEGDQIRMSDDGEPSGTAGRPIFQQILSKNLSYTLIVVVRYYGGINLGTSGLIQAYKTAAELALENSTSIQVVPQARIRLIVSYSVAGAFSDMIRSFDCTIVEELYTNTDNVYIIEVPAESVDHSLALLKATYLGRSIEDITAQTSLDEITIEVCD